MAGERDILRNLAFALDGHPISTGASKFVVKIGRERLPFRSYEDSAYSSDKGDWSASIELEGYGIDSEAKLLQLLAEDEENSGFLLLLESNTKLSPHASVGSAALFMQSQTFDINLPAEAGQIKRWTSTHENGDGHRPYIGKTIYTNRSKIPAPLGAGVVTPAPVTLLELAAGFEAVFQVQCTKISGTGTVILLCEILSDTPGFGSPIVRGTFELFTNEDPPTGTDVLGPAAQTIYLDGDVAAFPGETQWTIRFTVTDTDTDAQVEIMAAGAVVAK